MNYQFIGVPVAAWVDIVTDIYLYNPGHNESFQCYVGSSSQYCFIYNATCDEIYAEMLFTFEIDSLQFNMPIKNVMFDEASPDDGIDQCAILISNLM